MAASLISSFVSPNPEMAISPSSVLKSSFLSTRELCLVSPNTTKPRAQRCFKSPVAQTFDYCPDRRSFESIPKQFRQENLKEGLMENFKNVPKSLYGLSPTQIDMFMTEDNPYRRQAESVTEESISSAWSYKNHGVMSSFSDTYDKGPSKYSMSASMYRGGGRLGGKPRTAPPDLPSLLLDARIVYLGMPIVSAVSELIIAQFMFLEYDNPSKPIYFYINSPGTQNEKKEVVAADYEAFGIADAMNFCRAEVHTLNLGMAYGQAAMLLSLGVKGARGVMRHSNARLYLPKIPRSGGASTDLWIKGKELDACTDYYVELLAKGLGKPVEEVYEDARQRKFFIGQDAIDYGLADHIVTSLSNTYERRNSDERRARAAALSMRKGADGPKAAASGSGR